MQGGEAGITGPSIADKVAGDEAPNSPAEPVVAIPAVSSVDTPRAVQSDEARTTPPSIADKVAGDEVSNGPAEPVVAISAVSYVDAQGNADGMTRPLVADTVGDNEAPKGPSEPALIGPAVSYVDAPVPVQRDEARTTPPSIADNVGGDEASNSPAEPVVAISAVSYVDAPRPMQGNAAGMTRPPIADKVGGDEASSDRARPAVTSPAVSCVDTPRPVQRDEARTTPPSIADKVGNDEASNGGLTGIPMNGGPHAATSTPASVMVVGPGHDVIVTATGEEFSRSEIELRIANDPLFEHAIMIGNSLPFVAALVVLNASTWTELATAQGIDPDDPNTRHAETALIERIRSATRGLPSYCQVRRVHATLGHARRAPIIAANPAKSPRKVASQPPTNRLTLDQLRAAGGMAEQPGNGQLRKVFWAILDRPQ